MSDAEGNVVEAVAVKDNPRHRRTTGTNSKRGMSLPIRRFVAQWWICTLASWACMMHLAEMMLWTQRDRCIPERLR